MMRTTLNLDNDVLAAIKEIAGQRHSTAGAVASELIRASLTDSRPRDDEESAREFEAVFGFRPLPKRGGIVTNELVNRLREETQDL